MIIYSMPMMMLMMGMEDDNDGNDVIEEGAVVERPCLMDLVKEGWKILDKMNVKKVRMVADKRSRRKRQTTRYN